MVIGVLCVVYECGVVVLDEFFLVGFDDIELVCFSCLLFIIVV